jgi:hypothetical protein
MLATLDRIDNTTKHFTTDITGLIVNLPINHKLETDKMARYVLSDMWKARASEYAKRTVVNENEEGGMIDKLCQSLYYESMSYRELSISERHAVHL